MLIGKEKKDVNYIKKILGKNYLKYEDDESDNLLIIGNDRDGLTSAGILLGVFSSRKNTILVAQNNDFAAIKDFPESKDKYNKNLSRIDIFLDIINWNKHPVHSINAILESLNINEELLKNSKLIVFYSNKTTPNADLYANNFYSLFINYFLSYYYNLVDKKVLLAIDEFEFPKLFLGLNILIKEKKVNLKIISAVHWNWLIKQDINKITENFNLFKITKPNFYLQDTFFFDIFKKIENINLESISEIYNLIYKENLKEDEFVLFNKFIDLIKKLENIRYYDKKENLI